MHTVYLGLGSNVGHRGKNISLAVSELEKIGLKVQKISAIIETDPVGGPAQEKFLNAVLKAETSLEPLDLLKKIRDIENKLGRVRTVKNGPRTIDIDILLYDDLRLKTPELSIPHPKMLERAFVMGPLREIDPDIERTLLHENH